MDGCLEVVLLAHSSGTVIGKGHFEASQAPNLFKLGSIDDMEVGSLDEVLETDGEQVLALNLMLSTGAEAEIGLIPAQLKSGEHLEAALHLVHITHLQRYS